MTYLTLCGIFLGAVLVATLVSARGSHGERQAQWRPLVVTVGVLLVLTVVFDSLMIAADLFRYGQIAGPRVWLAPVEDLAWPVAVGVGLPVAWEVLRRRRTRPARAPEVPGDR